MIIEYTKEQLENIDALQNKAQEQLLIAKNAAQEGLDALARLGMAHTQAAIEFYKRAEQRNAK